MTDSAETQTNAARTRELKAAFIAKPLTDEALGAFLSGAALRLRKAKQ